MFEQLGIINFPAFVAAGIMLNITPGSDTLYILARTASEGKKAGILSALGISTGALIHTIAAACGLSVLLTQSATAFLVVKYLGALYLIYLGIRSLTTKSHSPGSNGPEKSTGKKIYFSGVLTNVLNPKVALFFLAFLPQFIVPGNEHSVLSFLLLGFTFVTTGTIWCLCLALFSSAITKQLNAGNGSTLISRITGSVFIALGCKLALSNK